MSDDSVVMIKFHWLTFYERTFPSGERVMSIYRDELFGTEQSFIKGISMTRSFKDEISSFISDYRLQARLEYESWQDIKEAFDEDQDKINPEPANDYSAIIMPNNE